MDRHIQSKTGTETDRGRQANIETDGQRVADRKNKKHGRETETNGESQRDRIQHRVERKRLMERVRETE